MIDKGYFGDNCSAIVIGKNATTTGHVLLAHGEDDPRCFVQSHLVPHMTHKEGEMLSWEDGRALIPQLPETLGFYWSEYRMIGGGEPFADMFFNECGVAVVSNAMGGSKIPEGADPLDLGGIGYGMRRLIAERATSARHAVEVVAELMEKYGYRSSRTYTVADKDEAWSIQLTTGNQFAARRIGDDEVYYTPNWYTIHELDFNNPDVNRFSPDVVKYAIDNGWYTPAREGDYSDFDFGRVYQGAEWNHISNRLRSDLAWSHLLDGEPLPYQTFSTKAAKKYAPADLKKILRLHYDGWEEDLKEDPKTGPHRYGICRDTTVESDVFEFADLPELTVIWRAFPRPCVSPYTPWFGGITKLPEGYEWYGPNASLRSHFASDDREFKYDANLAYWAFRTLQNVMEFDYRFCEDMVHGEIAGMEKEWDLIIPEIRKAYRALKAVDEKAAGVLLDDFTAAAAHKAWRWAQAMTQKLYDAKDQANMDFWRSKL